MASGDELTASECAWGFPTGTLCQPAPTQVTASDLLGYKSSRHQHKMDAAQSMLIRLTEDLVSKQKNMDASPHGRFSPSVAWSKFAHIQAKGIQLQRMRRHPVSHQAPQVYPRRCSTLNGTKRGDKRQA